MKGPQIVVSGAGRLYVDGDSIDGSAPLVFTMADAFSAAECEAMIARADQFGFETAPITTGAGFVMRPDLRNNDRAMFDDLELAAALFGRIRDAVPRRLCARRPVGVNERFRCYRYEPGQRFAPHYDGAYQRNRSERSELTFMIYLNDGFAGGYTAFHDFDVEVAPRQGMALLFQHQVLHEGCAVESGVKYVLRSDVMYGD
jgi:predicted 2-oxoglutarate/Fe(II)-dependent dioxygenase YbiX